MKYQIKWGEGYTQLCKTKKDLLALVSDLLNTYSNITISKL